MIASQRWQRRRTGLVQSSNPVSNTKERKGEIQGMVEVGSIPNNPHRYRCRSFFLQFNSLHLLMPFFITGFLIVLVFSQTSTFKKEELCSSFLFEETNLHLRL